MGDGVSQKKSFLKNSRIIFGILTCVLVAVIIGVTAHYILLTNSLDAKIYALNDQVVSLQGNFTNLQTNYTNLQTNYTNLQTNFSDYTSSHTHNDTEFNALQGNYSDYISSHTHNNTEFNSLQTNLTNIQNSYINLQDNFTNLQNNFTNLQTNYRVLNNDYNYLANNISPVNFTFGANNAVLTDSEIQNFMTVKNQLTVTNISPNYTGLRTLDWVSIRNASSNDYYQNAMEYLLYQRGQGANGEWQAVVSIYNSPGSTNDYVVEVCRFTWWELQVNVNGILKIDFPQIYNDTESLGYSTFHIYI